MNTGKGIPPPTVRQTEADPQVSSAPQTTAAQSMDLGLALSGGGVRATLFALGVIIALIQTGCQRRVRCVASVSGGSILNAALAHIPNWSTFSNTKEFEPFASTLASSLAWKGAFAFDLRSLASTGWYFIRVLGRAIPALIFGLALFADELRKSYDINLTNVISLIPWGTVAWIALASVLVSVLLSRGLLQEAKYQSVLSAVAASTPGPGKAGLYVHEWGSAPDGGVPRVIHVLVATDLLSGKPMYFSSQFVHCQPYGWSLPNEIRTAEALYSSAAFPAVFPTKWLRLGRLDFQNGDMQGELPRVVRLVDGGVYNNLGTDWFDVLQKQSQASQSSLWSFGELKVSAPHIEDKNVIVVNASAPSQPVTNVGLFPFSLARIMSVLYDNTVRPRVRSLQVDDRPLIDISESPIQLAQRLAEQEGEDKHRADALVKRLEGKNPEFWANFKKDTAGTATKLSSAGRRTAARLMLHGYLSSLALLHLKFRAKLPEVIHGEEYFLSLVDRTRSAAVEAGN